MLESFASPLRRAALLPPGLSSFAASRAPARPAAAAVPASAASALGPFGEHIAAASGAAEREGLSPLARCMAHMLDEIDYGMLLVDGSAQVLYLNHAARRELDCDHPLQLQGKNLGTAVAADAGALQEALIAAQRGLRKLLTK